MEINLEGIAEAQEDGFMSRILGKLVRIPAYNLNVWIPRPGDQLSRLVVSTGIPS